MRASRLQIIVEVVFEVGAAVDVLPVAAVCAACPPLPAAPIPVIAPQRVAADFEVLHNLRACAVCATLSSALPQVLLLGHKEKFARGLCSLESSPKRHYESYLLAGVTVEV